MRNFIYQITTRELEKEEYIDSSTFDDYNIGDFADYTEDIEEEDEEELLEDLGKMLEGVFRREGRKLIFLGAENFIYEWIVAIKDMVAQLDNNNIKDAMFFCKTRDLFEQTHQTTDARIWISENDNGTADPFGDFIRSAYANNKPGDVFYVGGIVKFHF